MSANPRISDGRAFARKLSRKDLPPSLVVKFKTAAGELKKYILGELLLRQRELLDGPVWSEGGIHFIFAGLADGNYASDY